MSESKPDLDRDDVVELIRAARRFLGNYAFADCECYNDEPDEEEGITEEDTVQWAGDRLADALNKFNEVEL